MAQQIEDLMKEDRQTLALRLREAREYLGLSQDEVAKATGIARTAVSLIETGQRKVDAVELTRMAALYRKSVDDLTAIAPRPVAAETVNHLARTAATLTASDQEELLKFAEFLRSKAAARTGR